MQRGSHEAKKWSAERKSRGLSLKEFSVDVNSNTNGQKEVGKNGQIQTSRKAHVTPCSQRAGLAVQASQNRLVQMLQLWPRNICTFFSSFVHCNVVSANIGNLVVNDAHFAKYETVGGSHLEQVTRK